MSQTYFKRYRMELALRNRVLVGQVPPGYHLIPWDSALMALHADVKYRSFRDELDALVFPCLGDERGCFRLMSEISRKPGFLPEATWLGAYVHPDGTHDFCGTIQGILDGAGGSIQNLGVTPEHRGRGLGKALLVQAIEGFRDQGMVTAYLEVTARNASAVRLYRQLGFRHYKTVYKSTDEAAVPPSACVRSV